MSHSVMVRGLVPSMSNMSVDPFWCDCRIGSYMIRYKGCFHSWNGGAWLVTRNTWSRTEGLSDMTIRCSITWSDVSAWAFRCDWGMCSHLIRYKGYFHFVMVRGLVPSMSDMSAEPFWYHYSIGSYMMEYKVYCHCWNGGAWSITSKTQSRTESHSDVIEGCVPTCSDVRDEPFYHG